MTKSEIQTLYKQAIQDHFDENEYISKEEARRIRERIQKVKKNSYSVKELEENLPEDLWTEIQDYLTDPEGPSSEDEDVAKRSTDGPSVEVDVERGDDLVKSDLQPSEADESPVRSGVHTVSGEDPFAKIEEIEVEDATLDHLFYEEDL